MAGLEWAKWGLGYANKNPAELRKSHIFEQLNVTSRFKEVYFSEMGEAEATHSRDPRKINFGEARIFIGKYEESSSPNR